MIKLGGTDRGKRAEIRGPGENVHAHEPADALRFAVLVYLEDVLFGRELERIGDDEFDVGYTGMASMAAEADAESLCRRANLADDDFSVTFWAIMLCA